EAGRCPAETSMAGAAVTHHGVEGVDSSVGECCRCTTGDGPADRGDDRVDGVFSHGLDDGSCDAGGVEVIRITSDECLHALTSEGQILSSEGFLDGRGGSVEGLATDRDVGCDGRGADSGSGCGSEARADGRVDGPSSAAV